MKITERRIVMQDWFESEESKTGWESEDGWWFKDTEDLISNQYEIVEILDFDKYGNPLIAIAEKETEIN